MLGSLRGLDVKCIKWSRKTSDTLSGVDIEKSITNILPEVVNEMEKLKSLSVDRTKPEADQKKQAGFIQQRKRVRLNELFKTLQSFGFSYRFGVTSCGDVNNYDEMYDHGTDISSDVENWERSEKYFFRCFARHRHLLTLLDRAPPPDIGSQLNERFQGFVQHMLSMARNWRRGNIKLLGAMTALERELTQFETPEQFDQTRNGEKYRQLLLQCLDTTDHMAALLEQRSAEYSEAAVVLRSSAESCQNIASEIQKRIPVARTIFAPRQSGEFTSELSTRFINILNLVSQAEEKKRGHPIETEFKQIQAKILSLVKHLDAWSMQKPLTDSANGAEELKVWHYL